MNESWSLISFGVVLDIIWCRRNEFIFNIDFIASNKLKDNVLAIVRDIRNSSVLRSCSQPLIRDKGKVVRGRGSIGELDLE
jgi:hypothetical protein